ncbi:putative olfactory receptor 4F15-like [Penaeus vannamei]|uniref:Putative olfactory receptor 4F15-like n=1 Tax=Penaeus vannamei TaxID=6689 RepID=A0A423U8K7_PENVA|nr:olfactory receptor 6N2-like [Penaeus vannamei]ROT84991.1 putative olfactory receptor 4F15-like [Penaeus vannamei]
MNCYTNLTSSLKDQTFKYYLSIPSSIIFGLVIVGESAVTLYINKRSAILNDRASTLFSNNLSLTNLFLGLYTFAYPLPRLICFNLLGHDRTLWWHCLLSAVVLHVLHLVDLFCLVCMALDRYLFLTKPLRYHNLITSTRCRFLAAATWTTALLVLLPFAVYSSVYVDRPPLVRCNTGTGAGVPFLAAYTVASTVAVFLVVLLYVLTAADMWCSKRNMVFPDDTLLGPGQATRKTAKEASKVLLFFIFLSVPELLLQWLALCLRLRLKKWLYLLLRITQGLHVVLYLPIYGWCTSSFRETLLAEAAKARMYFEEQERNLRQLVRLS